MSWYLDVERVRNITLRAWVADIARVVEISLTLSAGWPASWRELFNGTVNSQYVKLCRVLCFLSSHLEAKGHYHRRVFCPRLPDFLDFSFFHFS